MLEPIKVQKNINCFNIIKGLLYEDNSQTTSDTITDLTKEGFTTSTDYEKVFKNFDYNKTYDTWIYEGNEKDKIVGYKYLQSYPYDIPQFKIGDYIHWNFNHEVLSTWILISLDTQHLYNVKGRMLQCNNTLKWKYNNEIFCYPCVIEDSMTYTNFKWGSRGVVEPSGDIIVVVQNNSDTNKIQINDRFLFDGISFKVKQFLNELNPNYLEIYMMKTPELEGDDTTKNIAMNDNTDNNEEELNGIVVTPNVSEILEGKTVNFTIYKYLNGEKQEDEFIFEIKDVPKENYDFNQISGNEFSLTNNHQYSINPINISIVNKDNVNEKINKYVWLGGLW